MRIKLFCSFLVCKMGLFWTYIEFFVPFKFLLENFMETIKHLAVYGTTFTDSTYSGCCALGADYLPLQDQGSDPCFWGALAFDNSRLGSLLGLPSAQVLRCIPTFWRKPVSNDRSLASSWPDSAGASQPESPWDWLSLCTPLSFSPAQPWCLCSLTGAVPGGTSQ